MILTSNLVFKVYGFTTENNGLLHRQGRQKRLGVPCEGRASSAYIRVGIPSRSVLRQFLSVPTMCAIIRSY